MVSSFGGALLAENCPKFNGTALIISNAVRTQFAFLAPQTCCEIAAAAAGTMTLFFFGAIPAKQAEAKVHGAVIADIGAAFTASAFRAPAFCDILAGVAIGAVSTFFRRTIGAHIAAFLVGAAIADLRACAIGAFSALVAHLHALITQIAFAAIGGTVDPFPAVRASVSRMNGQRNCRNQSDYHYECHQRTDDPLGNVIFHCDFLLRNCILDGALLFRSSDNTANRVLTPYRILDSIYAAVCNGQREFRLIAALRNRDRRKQML